MQPEPEELKEHYASLSDDDLLELNRDDLTDLAKMYFDAEMRKRELDPVPVQVEETEPDWIENAMVVGAFTRYSGRHDSVMPDVVRARDAILAAGIPCYFAFRDYQYELMVPHRFHLEATSVLDQAIFNAQLAEEWRTLFQSYSDVEFEAVKLDHLTAGWVDRVERLTRAYQAEQARRRGEPTDEES